MNGRKFFRRSPLVVPPSRKSLMLETMATLMEETVVYMGGMTGNHRELASVFEADGREEPARMCRDTASRLEEIGRSLEACIAAARSVAKEKD